MQFSEYYNHEFRADLAKAYAALPPMHEHSKGVAMIQPRMIGHDNPIVHAWPEERRLLFAASLFLTTLADQVCFTHFRDQYAAFSELTRYPKWCGDCPGACRYHIHPGAIFQIIATGNSRGKGIAKEHFALLPNDILSTMKQEVCDFVTKYLPGTDPVEFWNHCDAEIPLDFRLQYMTSR
ncbi:MAG: hypothetical protein K8R92_04710 [Planctomycetes bacterium]|nr:hypothetical protein [Planctomycetota bacterium]